MTKNHVHEGLHLHQVNSISPYQVLLTIQKKIRADAFKILCHLLKNYGVLE